jgi:hypothetical protein
MLATRRGRMILGVLCAVAFMDFLGFSATKTGVLYLPVTGGIGVAAGMAPRLIGRIGTRPVIVFGALSGAVGITLLSRIPVHGSYWPNLLQKKGDGRVVIWARSDCGREHGCRHRRVPQHQAGFAAALLNASQQVGTALGLAVFTAIATARTNHLIRQHASTSVAVTGGYRWGLSAAAVALVIAAAVALRTQNVYQGSPTDT